jgi:tRNA modification GTPase
VQLCVLFREGRRIDSVMLSYMKAPRSYTGEDVIEMSCHGNPVVVEAVIDACVQLGARPARPGEFTRRAVENGKLSVLQAEALHGLLSASSPEGVSIANEGLAGSVDSEVSEIREVLLDICAELEASLDHPGGGLAMAEDAELGAMLSRVSERAGLAAGTWRGGKRRLQGVRVAILGPVNAGKSSLFNRLVGERRALVSARPGTTRDVVEKSVLLDGLEFCFLDTAGTCSSTGDPLEEQGLQLGLEMASSADLCVLVASAYTHGIGALSELESTLEGQEFVKVGTHLDLLQSAPDSFDILVSNKTGDGITELRSVIKSMVLGKTLSGEKVMILSQRQHDLFLSISRHALSAADALLGHYGPAVAAEEVTMALERIGELSGESTRERILDRLFSRFCIGK